MKLVKYLILIILAFVMSGCAANMPLSKKEDKIDLSSESIALVSVKISNQNKPGFQPSLLYAFFFPEEGEGEKTHIKIKTDPIRSEKEQFNEYIVSFGLKPGVYNFREIWGNYQVPLLINATCMLPLNAKIEIKPNSVVYLGHIDAVIRERKDDKEARAGIVIPLIDQAVAGFSNGTFDVVIKDRFEEDMGLFMGSYPALQGIKIDKDILKKWKRPEDIMAKTIE